MSCQQRLSTWCPFGNALLYSSITVRKMFRGPPTDSQRKRNTGKKTDPNHDLDPSTAEPTSDQTNSSSPVGMQEVKNAVININVAKLRRTARSTPFFTRMLFK